MSRITDFAMRLWPKAGSGGRAFLDGLWRYLRPVLIVYLIIVLIFMFCENWLIYFPSRYPDGDWQPRGFPCEDAWFTAADGTELHGWYAPHEHPRAVVLYCHGNGGNVAHWADYLYNLHSQAGVSVLLFDYRGYGRSAGRPSEAGLLLDARAARQWLAERAGIPEKEIVLLGRSLGGGVAVDLAAADGARALVLESTFTSLPDVGAYHYPLLPVRLLMRNRFDSIHKIANYHGPLLQSHGTADTIVPYKIGRRLFEAANEPKQFFPIQESDHNVLPPRGYYKALVEFLEGLPK